jgi:hypothetical protein
MSFETLRAYEAGRFHDVELPDWYTEANRLCEAENLCWHRALDRVLACDNIPLTDEGTRGGWIEVRFWPSPQAGTFVLIETPLGLVEQVVVLNPAEWLPFLTTHITPLIAATAQMAMADLHRMSANAFIAWARHGEGSHVDRDTGLSRIDLDNDEMRRRASVLRAAMARKG